MALNTISTDAFNKFREKIEKNSGIVLGQDKAYLVESRLSKLLVDKGLDSFDALYEHIVRRQDKELAEKVIDSITTNETLWFRDGTPWEVLNSVLMPVWLEQLRSGKKRKVRIWSAACSTGQEVYSTVMAIDRYLKERLVRDVSLEQFDFVASDISPTVIQLAGAGRYDSISIMRGLPEHYKTNYFTSQGRIWTLDPRIVSRVRFLRQNLQDSFIHLGKFDAIFCRYVMIYFSESFRRQLSSNLHRALDGEGVLFIGNSELFYNSDNLFTRVPFANGVYYQAVR